MIRNCPDPVEVQDIHFKLHCRLKLFENKELDTFATPHNLIACASRYGFLFAGLNSARLQAIQTSALENYNPKDKDIIDYPHRDVILPSSPKHISVNCDHTILAVVTEQDQCPVVIFYDVLSFYKQNVHTLTTVRLSSNPGTYVTEIGWNPAIPAIFTACKNDGSLGIYELKGVSVELSEIPSAAEVSSFCWSPKGKQIAVGSKKGTITQYKPDLKAVRIINAPPQETPSPLISLQWVSNYQFIGIYQFGAEGAKLLVVDAPKAGEIVYTNYDDICYSGFSTKPQFFMILEQHWNIVLVASSKSTELGVLGLTSSDSWTQWMITDASRAELPLSPDRQETFPIGLGLDISNTKPYLWGESTIAPCPYLLMLSHQGVLCIFDLVNLKSMPPICTPPDPIHDKSGMNQFQMKNLSLVPSQEKESKVESHMQSVFVEDPNKHQIEMSPQLSFQFRPSESPSNTTGFSFSSQVTSSQSTNMFSFTPSQTSSTLFGGNQKQTSLFGIQPAITAKHQSTSKPLLQEISITPINRNQQPNTKAIADDKYSLIFSALNTPQKSDTLPIQVKPIVISTPTNRSIVEEKSMIPTPTAEISVFPKSDLSIGSKSEHIAVNRTEPTFLSKPVVSSGTKTDLNLGSKPAQELSRIDTEAILQKMIKEDCISLDAEFRNLNQKIKTINVNLGSDPDKIEMLSIIQNLEEFLEEISEISVGEHSEIHTLKQNLVLSWAWYEEALSRYNASKDDMMKLLIKSQPLDSATEKRYNDIRKLIYYIESQLSEVSKALDEQWDKFQDYVKKTYKVQMPTMETIYQSMVRQNAILQKQGYIMKDISSQLKKKHRTSGGSLLLSVDNIRLEDELRRLQLDHQDSKYQLYDAVTQSKKISSIKSKKLQALLKNRDVIHVTTIKSFIPSETYQSPNKRLSLLGAKMSPVPKSKEPKSIDFSQSTPFRNAKLGSIFTNSTQIEIQPNKPLSFAISDGTSSNNILFSKSGASYSLTPTTSSQLLSSNLPSAFVPTTQAVIANKDKTWSHPTASSGTQIPSTVVTSQSKLKSSAQFMFSATTNLESQKPNSNVAFSVNSDLKSFSFASDTINNQVSSSNILVTPATANDTPLLFGSAFPKTVTTTSFTSKVDKPIKTVTILTSVSPITSANITKTFTGFSETFTSVSVSNSGTKTNTISESNLNFSSTVSSNNSITVNIPASTVGSTNIKESSLLNLIPNDTVTSSKSVFDLSNFGAVPTMSKSVTGSTEPTSNSVIHSSIKTTSAVSTSGTTISVVSYGSLVTTTSTLFSSAIATETSIFSATTSSTIFAPTATTSSVFTSLVSPSEFGTSGSTISSGMTLFGSKSTGSSSLFGVSSISTPTSLTPLFGTEVPATTTESNFETSSTSVNGTNTISSTTSEFANISKVDDNTVKSSQSIFGSISAPQKSIFGEPTTVSSAVFGSTTSTSIFGSTPTTTQTSIFGSTPTTTQTLIFGSTATTQTSIFGSTTTTTQTSIFGSTPTTTQTSIFGSTPTTSQTSIFGSTPTTTQTSIFGSTPKTTQTSIFVSTPTTTQTSIFGSTSTTTQTSIFGSTPTTQTSIFGSTATTNQTSIFGSSSTTTQTSIFGSISAPVTQSSLFGGLNSKTPLFDTSDATSATTQSSIFSPSASSIAKPLFGSTTSSSTIFPSTTANNSSPFGQSTTITFGSGFGATSTTPATSSSASAFGQQSSSAFGSNTGSIFGGTSTTSSGSIFGSNAGGLSNFGNFSSSGNLFGSPPASSFSFTSTPGDSALNFGGLNVDNSTTTTGSIFGSGNVFGSAPSATNVNPFGKTPEKSAFSGAGGNLFGSTATTTTSLFGSSTTFGANNQSSFGGSSIFGSSSFSQQQQPAFGQGTFGSTGTFGNTQPGPFSSGGAGVGQSGFGSTPAFQKPSSGFGSPPVFGGSPSPAFGGSPSFGGAPAFGAAPSFGSPTKVFGSNTPTAAFGSSSTGSPGFGNLANQNTIGFGNLAKQATNSPSSAFSGNSSFSSWR